ncbi:MAG: hypothetical protein JSR33_11265 [Proteobacteria bacterium]|nr:hypothetical protein [Pseudomonadota bacterium]
MQAEINQREAKNKFEGLNQHLLSHLPSTLDVENVSAETQREFRFIWTSLQPSALPYELDVDVLYIIKIPATILNCGKERNTIYWSEEDKIQRVTVDNSILFDLNFITFPERNQPLQFKLLDEFQSRQLVITLQPICNFSVEEVPYILQGPRQKTLATLHLEFIVKSYLMVPDTDFLVKYSPDSKDCMVSFDGFNFNLSAILKTNPGFDQIRFTSNQLDQVYAEKLHVKPSDYHSAEIKAIEKWSNLHLSMNNFLRGCGKQGPVVESLVLSNLLTICILTHAPQ